jgi:NitT/TauT family transport system permease protein
MSPRTSFFELRSNLPPRVYRWLAAAGFLAALLAWAWFSTRPGANRVFLPPPDDVGRLALKYLIDPSFWADVKYSVWRVTAGFLLAAAIALPLGMVMGAMQSFEALLQPLIEFVRYIPVPALIPLFMLAFGLGEMPKVMLIFAGTFFQLVLMVADEVRRVPYEMLQASYTLGAKRRETMRLVLWPAALPGIFDALRLCNGWAWTYLVVAELVAANEGLGYRILKFSRFLQTPKIFVYLIALGIIGLAFDFLFRRFNAKVFHWADTTQR